MTISTTSRAVRWLMICGLLWFGPPLNAQEAPADAQPVPAPADDPLAGLIVAEVRFEGLSNISETYCRNRVVTAAGSEYSPATVQEDVRRLVRSGKFLDVQVETPLQGEQLVVIFKLAERPTITAIEFVGNDKFSAADLLKEVALQVGEPLNIFAIRQGVGYIEAKYKEAGYAEVGVSLDEAALSENRVVYQIEEGPRVRVRKIIFEGRISFDEDKLLEKVSSKKYFPLLETGAFNPDQAQRDAAEIQTFYRDQGFLDARVSYRTESQKKEGDLRIIFAIDEGTRYTIESIAFEGQSVYTAEELQAAMQLKPGEFMRQDLLNKDIEALKTKYGENGYIYTVVAPGRVFSETPGQVLLTLTISEGAQYSVQRIVVRGNSLTQDKVVRRELKLFPDELFNTTKIKESESNIRSTGLFREAKITPVGDQPDVRDVIVDVEESDSTTQFIVGGGIGSNSGLTGTVSYEARNFDLFDWPRSWGEMIRGRAFRGAGQTFRIEASPGTELSTFRIDFREPYLLDKPLQLGTSFYLTQRGRQEYDEVRLGTNISLGKRFEDGWLKGWVGEVAFRLENVEISDIPKFPAEDIAEAEGNNLLATVKGRLVRNRTDSRWMPSKGDVLTGSYELAGGDWSFSKLESSYEWYYTLKRDEQDRPHIFALKGEIGYMFGETPVFERYYGGGIGTIRGFEFRGISPRDGPCWDDDQRIGGEFRALAGAEYSFPLYADIFRGVLFTDMGTVEEGFEVTAWRSAVGFGLRLYIPNYFGPVPFEFNFAFPVTQSDEDDTQIFSFAIGVTF
ncbi:MAG: Outer membrane protein assembly factor BamA [Phycisphaerae bacterium]|nr:Outer membrane protein assembly factor BamA [Phycisphaerae bacterium]